ncbi:MULTISPECIES: ErmE/ErmH/ErmO/ErmR family 23S rRNA (adenine(2058)-N(6))-methyltransferase [Streptosporangium]|uniref:23S rRNA (Adenine-N6)-dimethyltransferase n=1 Tax=Streptosporangium brasiliense TaxID=47480 RepID=A0ABT9RKK1_9ACTN|nr:ErmE/ErmH/ErmO/ErmR family 23S rRNA (adenine(2058)-N(6))-methyltransferase [Streptosporangium brasiliense]MDP9869831.1 23S rRNA (adenine-N6)-dimethyltransferase [Streptosporangium brasiliense]
MAKSFAHGDHSHTQKQVRNAGGRTDRDRARRVLSQNFLIDPHAVHRVVQAAGPHGLVLEPGAGEGVLTRALTATCKEIVAYEIDPRLAGRLAGSIRGEDAVKVVRGDFLRARAPREPFAVVGNIPYAITSKIVSWCLAAPALTSATLVTQLEYARKRTGDFGRWSLLTVLTWPEYSWRLLGRIGRESFRPVPQVDSAILGVERRPEALLPGEASAAYRAFVEYGFAGVGGSLHASLRLRHPARRVDAAFEAAGVRPDTVVAFVHPEQWLTLFGHLHPVG